MENVTVNKLELASELANMSLLIDYADKMKIYDEKENEITCYTDEAQDVFNGLYDMYLTVIENLEIKQ